jgi:zinc/manganese transport system ATP-binding protein
MNAQLQFRDLTLGYDRHPAVHHLNGGIDAGALIAVVGPNGAGKSTLFKGIVGLLAPLAGRIELNGLKRRDIAYLPQVADIDRSFPINVYDMIAMGLWRLTGLFGGVAARGARRSTTRSKPSGSPGSRTGRSEPCRAGRCSACCSRGCCCRMRV